MTVNDSFLGRFGAAGRGGFTCVALAPPELVTEGDAAKKTRPMPMKLIAPSWPFAATVASQR